MRYLKPERNVARKPKTADERPTAIIRAEIRVYTWEPELAAYFAQFQPRQHAAAIKRAIRAALTGGELGLGGHLAITLVAEDDDDDDFADFVS